MSETEFRQALSTAPGLYFDWQGEIPVAVLNGWLSVDNQTLTGTVRRMVLTAVEGQVLLYYWDESAEQGWACALGRDQLQPPERGGGGAAGEWNRVCL